LGSGFVEEPVARRVERDLPCISRGDGVSYARKVKVKKKCTNLVDDRVEVAAGEGLLDLLLQPPIWCRIGYIGLVSLAATTGDQGNDTAVSAEDDGTRVSWGGEGATLAVGYDGGLHGRVLDAVLGVDASDGVKSVDPAYGGASGQPVLHHR